MMKRSMESDYRKILAAVAPEYFVGRTAETDAVRRHANGAGGAPALLVASAPGAGASELLRQIYDRLFYEQNGTIPIYFAVKDSDKTAKGCAVRFLQTFITQTVAFRRRDAGTIDAAPDICELAELAVAEDGHWIDRLIAACRLESDLNNERAFVRQCLSASLRAAAAGTNCLVILDDLHEASFFSGEVEFIEEVREVFNRSKNPSVLAGRRRFLAKEMLVGNARMTGAKLLPVEPLAFVEAGKLTESLAARYGVEINEPTRDLIAVKFQGNALFTEFLVQAASEKQTALDSFGGVAQLYANEICGGRIGKFYDATLEKIAADAEQQKAVGELFQAVQTADHEKMLDEDWTKKLNLAAPDARRLTSLLNVAEIVRWSSNRVEAMTENEVLTDYLAARYRLEVAAENRAAVVGGSVSQFLKRAPQTMANFYRRSAASGLRELLALFNGQDTPLSLLDYSIYKERLKQSEAAEDAAAEQEKIVLPQIVFTAHTAAFYPPFERLIEKTRSAVALGFAEKIYNDADETVWLAAEIDSKLEASKETAEFWCDRLEMVALTCNFPKYVVWLVAPEGFAPAAVEVLKERNAIGSSRQQVESLKSFLRGGTNAAVELPVAEYEMVVPMGDDSELMAAAAIEEIARRHRYPPKAINQMKTAMVEACINAVEHSLSPERKIYQKITVATDRITVTIANRGLRLADKSATEISPDEGRRGWGLKLMKTLMDEVKFERVDDGTRISMTKYRR